MGGVDVGVDFGGEDALVTEHFLHDAQVGAVLDQVRGEGMPEGVRRNLLAHACNERLFFDQVKKRNTAYCPAKMSSESVSAGSPRTSR